MFGGCLGGVWGVFGGCLGGVEEDGIQWLFRECFGGSGVLKSVSEVLVGNLCSGDNMGG